MCGAGESRDGVDLPASTDAHGHVGEAASEHSLKEKASWFADLPGRHVVGQHVRQNTRERLRVWEVRRFCQVKPALLTYHSNTNESVAYGGGEGDYALTAILRCVMSELQADIAYVSLLDDQTQYFIAGATKSQALEAARASHESTQWFGCDSVLHAGGLCNRTLRLEGDFALYEELDMSTQDYTRELPFVDGRVASFRWYAGVPITTSEGHIIGTVFLMANKPAQAFLSPRHHDLLCTSAQQIMKQLDQAVQALEGRRLTVINAAVTSLARARHTPQYSEESPAIRCSSPRLEAAQATTQLRDFYQRASQLLLEGFEFNTVFLQEVPLHSSSPASGTPRRDNAVHILSVASTLEAPLLHAMDPETASQICEFWPEGEIFSRIMDSDGPNLTSNHLSGLVEHPQKRKIGRYLAQTYPEAEQLLVMPMWDPLYDRVTALTLGISQDYGRVYTHKQDLYPIAAFCTSFVHHVHRMEANHMDQKKSDFLGSVSHEMRSPLHGMLGNLELALEMSSTEEQHSMLQTAKSSGSQLLTLIDKVLDYAQISADSSAPGKPSPQVAIADMPKESRNDHGDDDGAAHASGPSLLEAFEATVQRAVVKVNQTQDLWQLDDTDASAGRYPQSKISAARDISISRDDSRKSSAASPVPLMRADGIIVLLDVGDVGDTENKNTKTVLSVLEELTTNALNHTSEGCIRISLQHEPKSETDARCLVLCVEDCGTGIHQEFLKHRLFVPFSQENQIDSGTGLGLALANRNVASLGGTISFESEVSVGTKVIVRLPIATLGRAAPAIQGAQPASPGKTAHLYSPPWSISTPAQRAHDMVESSLSRTLLDSCNVRFLPRDSTETPELLIVSDSHLAALAEDDRYQAECPRLVLHSAARESSRTGIHQTVQTGITIASPIVPSRVSAAILDLQNVVTPVAKVPERSVARSRSRARTDITDVQVDSRLATAAPSRSDLSGAGNFNSDSAQGNAPCVPESLSVLLVDDNLVNLKLLAKYVKRCGVEDSTLAKGGQEAIDAFRDSLNDGSRNGFDIVFMDLSMPTVSGIDATRAIRQFEKASVISSTTGQPMKLANIIALTGLTSAKDRKAAFDAGVNQYMTKPANLASIQGAIRHWTQEQTSIVDGQRIAGIGSLE